MPLNLEYLDNPPYVVTPVRHDDGSFSLEIDGNIVPVDPDQAAQGLTSFILEGKQPQTID